MNHAYLWDSASKAKSFVICCLSIGISDFRLQIGFPDIATLGLLKEGGRHSWWHFEMAWQQCGQKVLAECQAGTRRQYLGISPKVRTSKSSKHCHFFFVGIHSEKPMVWGSQFLRNTTFPNHSQVLLTVKCKIIHPCWFIYIYT